MRALALFALAVACRAPSSTPPAAAPAAAAAAPAAPAPADRVAPSVAPMAPSAATPWIGIALEPGTRGVRVKQVIDDAPGARAGILVGDEVLAIDALAVREPRDLISAVAAKGVGTRVSVGLSRNGAAITVQLVLEPKPEMLELLRRKVVDHPAPSSPLADAYGPYPVARLADYRGNVVLVELGASWCGFCRSTLPTLSAWQRDHAAAGLRILWLSSEDLPTIRAIEPSITNLTRARDPDGALASSVGSASLPTFLLIDRTGTVRAADIGAGAETLSALSTLITQLLAEP